MALKNSVTTTCRNGIVTIRHADGWEFSHEQTFVICVDCSKKIEFDEATYRGEEYLCQECRNIYAYEKWGITEDG